MARKNRVTVPDGIYHITSRVCNQAMLFKSDEVKERIRDWVFDVAYFSGVEIYAWCIMDNHLHLLVHVPRVPERLWTDSTREPVSWAFGMRPPECFPPLWAEDSPGTPISSSCGAPDGCIDDGSRDVSEKSFGNRCFMSWSGDSPSVGACAERSEKTGVDAAFVRRNGWGAPSRPEVGFMLDDDEMLDRLSRLYSKKSAEEIGVRWNGLRQKNRGDEVEREKAKYCRRMYNISQFVKTLKERIAMRYNAKFDHEGCLWQGRFYSGIIENCREVLSVVAGYIDYNPTKAKLVDDPAMWRYSSWSEALGSGPNALFCRNMYCKMFDCDWCEAKAIMMSVLTDGLPDGADPEDIKDYYDKCEEVFPADGVDAVDGSEAEKGGMPRGRLRASQVIRCRMWFFQKGCYIGRTLDFAYETVRHLASGFPRAGFKSIKRCRAFTWDCLSWHDGGESSAA